MLNLKNISQFIKQHQTTRENITREYCQHLFLSYLYQIPGSEKLLFKGGTALRIVFNSPRFSEDLDFTGTGITAKKVEALFTETLSNIERAGIGVELQEGKATSGGYLGIAYFSVYNSRIKIQIEVSLRAGENNGEIAVINGELTPPYTLTQLSTHELINEKIIALVNRKKPRDFYDYFFLLAGNYPAAKTADNLRTVLKILRATKINFSSELRKFLPASQSRQLRDFKNILETKILNYLGK